MSAVLTHLKVQKCVVDPENFAACKKRMNGVSACLLAEKELTISIKDLSVALRLLKKTTFRTSTAAWVAVMMIALYPRKSRSVLRVYGLSASKYVLLSFEIHCGRATSARTHKNTPNRRYNGCSA
jgi:hypothetical protein